MPRINTERTPADVADIADLNNYISAESATSAGKKICALGVAKVSVAIFVVLIILICGSI